MNKIVRRYSMIFLVMNLVGIAVALFLQIQLGSDSIGLLCDGLNHFLPYSYGTASLVYNLGVIAIALMVAKKNLGVGTIAYALLAGYFIDFYCLILKPFSLSEKDLIIRLAYFLIGQICLSTGLAILIQLKLGMNALDAVLTHVSEKSKISYVYLRTATDLIYVVIGTALGGTFGVGTVISVLATGFFISQIIKVISKFQTIKNYEVIN